MTLIETVQQLDKIAPEQTIYVREPWTSASESKLAIEGSPEERVLRAAGLRYFLEVFVAREFFDDWMPTQTPPPSADQKCARLIEYVTNDA